jgi:hypothetical protein
MDAADPTSGVFIMAQGLLTYLEPQRVVRLFTDIAVPSGKDRVRIRPTLILTFDAIGAEPNAALSPPTDALGIDRNELEPTLRRWNPHIAAVTLLDYANPRELPRFLVDITKHIPVVPQGISSLVSIATPACQTATSKLPLKWDLSALPPRDAVFG